MQLNFTKAINNIEIINSADISGCVTFLERRSDKLQ